MTPWWSPPSCSSTVQPRAASGSRWAHCTGRWCAACSTTAYVASPPMAEPGDAKATVDEFLSRQREMYAGGELEPVAELLADHVVWHVPGASPIAGDYRGREAVLGYFRRRRELAGGAMEITKRAEAYSSE